MDESQDDSKTEEQIAYTIWAFRCQREDLRQNHKKATVSSSKSVEILELVGNFMFKTRIIPISSSKKI